MFISVIVATKDRHDDLKRFCSSVSEQSILPNEVILVDSSENSIRLEYEGIELKYIHTSQRGSSVQRNIGIQTLNPLSDIVFFFDDDVILEPDYMETILEVYKNDADRTLGGVHGFPLQDGEVKRKRNAHYELARVESLYGCNMSFRAIAIKNVWFDEKLALYGWMEDWDFSTTVGKKYELKSCNQAYFYHMSSPKGRVNGKKLGFMQISNRHYLHKKHGRYSKNDLVFYAKQTLSNLLRSYSKVYYQRFRGNLKAIIHIVVLGKEIDSFLIFWK